MSQVDWKIDEESGDFIILLEDWQEDLEDCRFRCPNQDAWYHFRELIGEAAGMEGFFGNSQYKLYTIDNMLCDMHHAEFVRRWNFYYKANARAENAHRFAVQDVQNLHEFFLKNAFGERYRLDWYFIIEADFNDDGNIVGFYNIWAWKYRTDPIYNLEKGLPLAFRKAEIPEDWRKE